MTGMFCCIAWTVVVPEDSAVAIKAKRRPNTNGILQWVGMKDGKPLCAIIETIGQVDTIDGKMIKVNIYTNGVIDDPTNDVAMHIGYAVTDVRPGSWANNYISELWLWGDKYWLKAIRTDGGGDWYKKSFLLYEVRIYRSPSDVVVF